MMKSLSRIMYLFMWVLCIQEGYAQLDCDSAVPLYNGYDESISLEFDYSAFFDETSNECLGEVNGLNLTLLSCLYEYTLGANDDRLDIVLDIETGKSYYIYAFTSCSLAFGRRFFDQCIGLTSRIDFRNMPGFASLTLVRGCDFDLPVGTKLYFGVFEFASKTRKYDLNVRFKVYEEDDHCGSYPRGGDDCVDAPMIDFVGPYTASTACCFNNTREFPTLGPNTSLCASVDGRIINDQWIKFIAADTIVRLSYDVDYCHEGSGIELALYRGDCANFIETGHCYDHVIGSGDVIFSDMIPGETYFLMFDAGNNSSSVWTSSDNHLGDKCDYSYDLEGILLCDHDMCGSSQAIVCGKRMIGTLSCATAIDAPVSCSTGLPTSAGVWYSYAGTGDPLTVYGEYPYTDFGLSLQVYQGDCVSLGCVPSAMVQGTDRVSFDTECGKKYYLYVSSLDGHSGKFSLGTICTLLPCTPPTLTGPNVICIGGTAKYVVNSGCVIGSWRVQPRRAGYIDDQGNFTSDSDYSGEVVIVYNEQSCEGTIKVQVGGITPEITMVRSTCNLPDGRLSVSPYLPGYEYRWSNGASDQKLSNLRAGTYTVTVTDTSSGCLSSSTIMLENSIVLPNAGIGADITLCSEDTTVVNLMELISGNPQLGGFWDYVGNPPNPSAYDTNLGLFNPAGHSIGTFRLRYNNANICGRSSSVINVTILDVTTSTVNLTAKVCNGQTDHKIDLNTLVIGGDLSGVWRPMATYVGVSGTLPNLDFGGVVPGVYLYEYVLACTWQRYIVSITVTACGCSAILDESQLTLCNSISTFDLSKSLKTNLLGAWQIKTQPSGGTIAISNSTMNLNKTIAGEYELTYTLATPIAGCPSTGILKINIFNQPNSGSAVDLEVCDTLERRIFLNDLLKDADIGGDWILSTDSEVPLLGSYDQNNGSFVAKGQDEGIYKFKYLVSGNAPCTSAQTEISIKVKNCDCKLSISSTQKNNTCYNGEDGEITITLTGVVANATIRWNDPIWDNQTKRTNLASGDYYVSVTDGDCKSVQKITISSPEVIEVLCTTANTSQIGLVDGVGNVEVSGGTPPYNIKWQGTASGQSAVIGSQASITDLPSGAYQVSITDANDCQANCEWQIDAGDCGMDVKVETIDLNCYNSKDGEINLEVLKNIGNPIIKWNTLILGSQTNLTQLTAGSYTVTITDDKTMCEVIKSITLQEPQILEMSCTSEMPSKVNVKDGKINLTISGGTMPYNVMWQGSGQGQKTVNTAGPVTLTSLGQGKYDVIVVDIKGCTISCQVDVPEHECTLIVKANTTPTSCDIACDGMLSISVTKGSPLGHIIEFGDGSLLIDTIVSQLCSGRYTITVTDFDGCQVKLETISIDALSKALNIVASKNSVQTNDKITLNYTTELDSLSIISVNWSSNQSLSCDTCHHTILTMDDSQDAVIELELIDQEGCVLTAKMILPLLRSKGIILPNIIRQDGGKNSRFYIQGNDIARIKYLRIYDRWGGMRHEATNFPANDESYSWQSTEEVNGVYVYELELIFTDGTTKQYIGDVTVVK